MVIRQLGVAKDICVPIIVDNSCSEESCLYGCYRTDVDTYMNGQVFYICYERHFIENLLGEPFNGTHHKHIL